MDRRQQDVWREALRATSLGWDLALPIFGGVLLGHALDRSVSTTYAFTLGFLFLGIAVGFYNVIRSIHHMDEQSRRRRTRNSGQDGKEGEAAS